MIIVVLRMYNKVNGVRLKVFEEDYDIILDKYFYLEVFYENRCDSLVGFVRKVFSVEFDFVDGSLYFSEINYKLDKELSGVNDLFDIGFWNDDDEEYFWIYKFYDCSVDGFFVDILEDIVFEFVVVGKNNYVEGMNIFLGRKKWGEFFKNLVVSNYDGGLYCKSNIGFELDILM